MEERVPLDLLAALIRINSTSGSPGESEVIDYVGDWFGPHTASRVFVSKDHHGRSNGLLVLPSVDSGERVLIFACHADVVPVGNAADWTSPPFEPRVDEGRLVGRGSSDMKSGLAAAMISIAWLHESGARVALAVSTGEEVGSVGAPTIVNLIRDSQISTGAMVIPESTNNKVVLGHRGALWLGVETTGVATHGSTPELGRNAILSMARILGRIGEVPLTTHPQLGAETVNVGTIDGGTVPNVVPDHARIRVDHRVVDLDVGRIIDWWRNQPTVSNVSIDLALVPVWTAADDPWVASLPSEVLTTPAAYFTDASVFTESMPPAPVVVWGPGDPTSVHSANESVDLASLDEAIRLYKRAGIDWQKRQDRLLP
ncbi:M20 family metallopeptidase [Frigoribacterium sp. UYMn621]|uniref:M20 family metallopeptidase n=1 Tax=Frigoribacterium sp. UYMn621 TaxID=3156343 RepID=UPI0033929DB3